MFCLEVAVDGVVRCRAGIGEFGVLNAILDWRSRSRAGIAELVARDGASWSEVPREELSLHIGGMEMDTGAMVRWAAGELVLGSAITLRMLEAVDVDGPSERDEAPQGCRMPASSSPGDEADRDPPPDGKEARTDVCFDVFLDDKRLCRAGLGDHGGHTVVVSWVSRSPENLAELSARFERPESDVERWELSLHVVGLGESSREHVRWVERPLVVGDVVRVEVLNSDDPDPPSIG